MVAGIPIAELRRQLLEDFRKQLQNPPIIITPLRRIYVLEEVQEPGQLTVDPTISLAGAVALAGGATGTGDLRRIRAIRERSVILDGISATTMLGSVGIRSDDQIFVGERSWFARNSTLLIGVLLSVTSVVVSLAR